MTRIKRTHLELLSPEAFRPSIRIPADVVLMQAVQPSPELNRFLYAAVGAEYHWNDRLPWTWSEWMAWLSRPGVQTWVAYQSGTPVGYFELEAQDGGNVEIVYFGLLPSFIGRGLGGYLLTQAVQRAFAMRADIRRVWLHTCTLDHPGGLAGYQAHGFSTFKEEEIDMTLSETPTDPWPGAERPR